MIPDPLLANVATHTHNPVVITDAGGATIWVNPAFERLTGYTLDHMRGRKPGAVLQGPQTDPLAVQSLRSALGAGQPVVGLELLNYDRDGREYWIELDITPVRDADGRLTHFIAIQTPVSARREAQQAIAALSKRLTIALGAAGLGVWDLPPGPDSQLVLDGAAVRLLGLPGLRAGEALTWSALPPEFARWRDAAVQALLGGSEVDVEVWIDGQAGRRCLRIRGQRVGDGPQARVAGVIADETAARESQSRAEALALQTMLEVERRDVLGRLRREFRLPLNSLLGFAQLARVEAERGGLGDVAGRIGDIESAGLKLLDMLDELLASAAAGSGDRATLQPVLLRDMLERHLPREVALEDREHIGPHLAVWADPTLLRRTLSLAGGLGLQAGASGSGPRLRVLVEADGPTQRVGLRFRYPAAAGQPVAGERSLRTDLIGRLLSDMGGSSELAGSEDGLQFTLYLRAARGLDDGADDGARAASADVWATRGDIAGEVLYVEDDPGNVAIVEHALRSRPGVRLRVAGDVASALAMLDAGPAPHLLLLDLTLPGASGRELLATLRADPRWATLPCVVLTSINDIAEETALRTQGADDYLTKPLRLDRLLSVIDGYLQGRSE